MAAHFRPFARTTPMRPGLAALAAVFLALLSPASAQPGALDPSFGSDGLALGVTSSLGRDVALDSDERIVFVGAQAPAGVPDGALVGRLLPDGSLDDSFAGDGIQSVSVLCPIAPRTILEAVEVAPDDAVVAAGTTGCRRGVVVRLLENGAPDHAFATVGVFTHNPDADSRSSAFFGVDVAPDGTVVAVGREDRDEPGGEVRTYLLVVRLTPEGQPDVTFGTGGVVRLLVSDDLLPNSQLSDLVIYPDGRVLATGHVTIGGAVHSVAVRLNADGTPDATFEGGGLVVHDLGDGNSDAAHALVYGPDGAIYLGGSLLADNTFAFFAARLRFDGTRDPSFGANGVAVVQAAAGASCVARDVVLDLQGRLALAGDCAQSSNQLWAIARVLPDGGRDSSFGEAGVARPPAPGTTQTLYGLVRQGDGRLVVGGSVVTSGIPVWAVARVIEEAVSATDAASANGAPALAVAPNPAASAARIRFALDAATVTTVTLHDALGRMASRLDAGALPAGAHEREIDVSSLAPGVYVLRLQAGARTVSRRLTVR